MHLILCHTTADFDALGAAVGVTKLVPGSKLVLTGGAHPKVRDFLALYRHEYAIVETRSVDVERLETLTIVDTQQRQRLGRCAAWLDLPQLTAVVVYDHHYRDRGDLTSDIAATHLHYEAVGATTTIVTELLQAKAISLTPAEATVMALGIHVDTGSLTFAGTTSRDAVALAWLLQQGANIEEIGSYVEGGLSLPLRDLLSVALAELVSVDAFGYRLGWVHLPVDAYLPGLSSLTAEIINVTNVDVLLLAASYPLRQTAEFQLTAIGRSRLTGVNLGGLMKLYGGGGHDRAASAQIRVSQPKETVGELWEAILKAVPVPPIARDLMSSPVRTIPADTTIAAAARILLRYGHSGLCVVDLANRLSPTSQKKEVPQKDTSIYSPHPLTSPTEGGIGLKKNHINRGTQKEVSPEEVSLGEITQLVGIISRRDIDLALHHGLGESPVKGYMKFPVKTIALNTPLPEIQRLMVTYDIGRLPVCVDGELRGIVTRTDVLRQLYRQSPNGMAKLSVYENNLTDLKTIESNVPNRDDRDKLLTRIKNLHSLDWLAYLRQKSLPQFDKLIDTAAKLAMARGWQLYLVGGAVRDLILDRLNAGNIEDDRNDYLSLTDLDFVVDGFDRVADEAAGVELAKELNELYPHARLEIHGKFQTAALLWEKDDTGNSLWVDIATARTEFYPYPAANPEVEASSIGQDLYRRDFTINALALCLSGSQAGKILDFFGGMEDLVNKHIRVLHANSFIEDPTRIYRATRFATRLNFQIESRTKDYIKYAIDSDIYPQAMNSNKKVPALQTRLKAELKYMLEQDYWFTALCQLNQLNALTCISSELKLNRQTIVRLHYSNFLLQEWQETKDKLPPNRRNEKIPLPWQFRLEILLNSLPLKERDRVAKNLQLPEEIGEKMNELESLLEEFDCLEPIPSQITLFANSKPLSVLAIVYLFTNCKNRHLLEKYYRDWMKIQSPLNGRDLQELGYRSSPRFKEILEAVFIATIDGKIITREEAIDFVRHLPE